MLNDVTEFDVVPEYKIRGTTFWVSTPGVQGSIARIRKDVAQGAGAQIHRVFVGPNLDDFAGIVNTVTALDAKGVKVGKVSYLPRKKRGALDAFVDDFVLNNGSLNSADGHTGPLCFQQEGREPMFGKLGGALGGVVSGDRASNVDSAGGILPFSFAFKSSQSAGFEMSRGSSVGNRFHFSVHDPGISRLLMFTCLLSIQEDYSELNAKKFLTETVAIFDPKSWGVHKKKS